MTITSTDSHSSRSALAAQKISELALRNDDRRLDMALSILSYVAGAVALLVVIKLF
jgi:hypothetical protein